MRQRRNGHAWRHACAFAAMLAICCAEAAANERAAREEPVCRYTAIKRGVVTHVLSATSVRLDDGKVLQFQSVLAPTVVDVVGGAPEWPIAEAARKAVTAHLTGRNIQYALAGKRPDRYGRLAANVWLAAEQAVVIATPAQANDTAARARGRSDTVAPARWVQRWMLAGGHARFAPYRDRSGCADILADAERRARQQRVGLWALDAYRSRPAWKDRDLSRFRNTFQIVAGRVAKVSDVRGRLFINFGRNWRTDFTAAVSKRQLRYFERAGLDLKTLEGRRVEVRGWVDYRGGPYIEIEHTHQIRRLSRADGPGRLPDPDRTSPPSPPTSAPMAR